MGLKLKLQVYNWHVLDKWAQLCCPLLLIQAIAPAIRYVSCIACVKGKQEPLRIVTEGRKSKRTD